MSTIIVHCMDNFLSVRPENQRRRQLEVRFYSRSCIIQGDQLGYSSGGRIINYILQHMLYVFNEVFVVIWIKCFLSKKHFSFLSLVVWVALIMLNYTGTCIFQKFTACTISKYSVPQAKPLWPFPWHSNK